MNKRIRAAAAMLHIAWTADPRRSLLAFGLHAISTLAQTLLAWWLKLALDGLAAHDSRKLMVAAIGMAASIAATTAISYGASRVQMELRDRAHHLVERRLIDLVGSTPTLEIHETPEHLTQLEVLDDEAWQFGQVIPTMIDSVGTVVRIVSTTLLLISVHPLLLILPLFGLPALLLSSKTGALFRLGNERAAEPTRRANHIYELATTAGAAKEVRLFRLDRQLLRRFHVAHTEIQRIHRRVNINGELLGLANQLVFLIGYVGAIVFVVDRTVHGRATVGDAALTAVLAGQVLGLLTNATDGLQATRRSLASAGRFLYLRDIALRCRDRVDGTATAPDRLQDGIRCDHISYRYPRASTDTLHDITLHLPAGTTVAIVGDNGAGKTTLVKLLAGLYLPGSGRITVDGTDLATLDPDRWRRRVSAGFQDHARFEFILREAIGIGHLPAIGDQSAVRSALARAGGDFVIGLDTQLGPNWPGGIDLSGGQWQKVAIARAMMRTRPLLLLLDEPTAALDADTEHHLFQRWTSAARALRETSGAVTILVSHRFSTVRMADLIIVLDGGSITETGTHDELVARNGRYAELYELQARTYR